MPGDAPCTTGDLHVQGVESDGTAGTMYVEVIVDASHTACAVDGYPDVSLYGKVQGVEATLPQTPVHQALDGASPMGVGPSVHVVGVLSSGSVAFFVAISQVPSSTSACHTARGLEFQAPGASIWSGEVPFTSPIRACGTTVGVAVFQAPISEG